MTKTPIEPKDIRKGDLIRKEYGAVEGGLSAVEYVAAHEADGGGEDSHFLLERPKPVVVLPTEPGAYQGTYKNGEKGSLYVLDTGGRWHDFSSGHSEQRNWTPTNYAPLTKLEPVAETAKHFVAAYFAYSSGTNRTLNQLDQAVEDVARKEFGATS